MSKLKLFIIFFLTYHLSVVGQNSIQGIVLDSIKNSKLSNCTVQLLKKDELKKGTVTDSNGYFIFYNLPKGNYKLKIDFLGYTPYTRLIQLDSNLQDIKLKPIILVPLMIKLETVTLKAKRNLYKQALETTEVRFSKKEIKKNPRLLGALQKVSGVLVNSQNKSISLFGSENVLLLINGVKKSIEEIAMLKTNEIDYIEIIETPGVQYKSTASSVLNIITKKNKVDGFTLDLDLYGYVPNIYNFSNIKIQYGFQKIKLYSFYNLWLRRSSEELKIRSIKKENDTIFEINESFFDAKKRLQVEHYLNYGIDIFPNDKNYINISGDYKHYKQDIPKDEHILFYKNNELISENNLLNNEIEIKKSFNYSLYYNYIFNKTKNLYIVTNLYQTHLGLEKIIILKPNNKEEIIDLKLNREKKSKFYKMNYTVLLAKKYKIESGISVYNRQLTSEFYNEPIIKSTLNYNETQTNAYINLKTKINKIAISSGIAFESQILKMDAQRNNNINFLPSIIMQYKINNNQNFKFGYIQKLKYPTSYQLSKYSFTVDNYNVYIGNPSIKAFVINNTMLSYAYKSKGVFISPSLSFSYIKNPVNEIIDFTPNQHIVHSYDNIGQVNKWAFKIISSFSIGKIKMNPSIIINYDNYQTPQENWSGKNYAIHISPDYTFENGLNASVNLYYKSKSIIFKGNKKMTPSIDFSISKNFLNNNLSVKINISPFDDRQTITYIFDDIHIEKQLVEHYKNINFEITYSFMRGKQLKNKKNHFKRDSDF